MRCANHTDVRKLTVSEARFEIANNLLVASTSGADFERYSPEPVECSSGFLSITGTELGEQVRSGYAVADVNAGMHAAIGILLALRARDQTGFGRYVDVAMQDSMIRP